MQKIDSARIWALDYRLIMSVISEAAPGLAALGLEPKELFLLSELTDHPYPAELANELCMPKATITVYIKRLESAKILRREIDRNDLRRYRLELTPHGREVAVAGIELLTTIFSDRLARLDASERRQLLALFEKMS